MERNQKSLWDKIKFNHLNLWKRDATIKQTIREHRQKGLTLPHIECSQDVENLRKGWKWEESLLDGGIKIRIGQKAFYVMFNSDGNLQRLTPWDNYLAEIQAD